LKNREISGRVSAKGPTRCKNAASGLKRRGKEKGKISPWSYFIDLIIFVKCELSITTILYYSVQKRSSLLSAVSADLMGSYKFNINARINIHINA
jgi:hypothetical protein